jgi:xanthine dehydrogenase YagR molybdenum-binding subunit
MPWPEKRVHIGSHAKRIDAPVKITGAAKYSSDMRPEGCLYGMILRSKWAKAKITSINLEKAAKMPGIKAAILAREGERTVRYYGEELAAVAGTTKQACLDALRVIEVEAKELPFVVREEDAREAGSARVWEEHPNLSEPKLKEEGEVDQAFSECAAVVEGFFTTPVQLHHPLETHGNTISWTDEGVTAWSSTQGITSVRDGCARNLKVPQSNVRVICEFMGGGFVSKVRFRHRGRSGGGLSQAAGAP